jgi:hypothetical protein
MALKVLLDTLDGVDDAVKTLYAERDGKFVLDVEGVDDHPDVSNLKSAYSRTKADRETVKTEAAALKAKIAELEKGAPDTAATQAKLTAMQEQLAEAEAKAGDWQTKYTSITRDQALSNSLQSAGITNPTFLKAATTMLAGQVKLGEDGTAYVETGMGPKVLADFVKGWAASDGKDFVTPPQGGGAKGNDRPTTGKSMTRAQFEQLDAAAKASAMSAGTVLTD